MGVIQLTINNYTLELTDDKYSESYSAVDTVNKSEAGTTLRAVVRTGIPTLSVSYKCIDSEKALLDYLNKQSSLTATRWSEEDSGADIEWTCYMSNYSADLIVDGENHRFYKVSFKLNDLEN